MAWRLTRVDRRRAFGHARRTQVTGADWYFHGELERLCEIELLRALRR